MTSSDLLNATTQALSNGITGLPISTAMDTTEDWQQQLLQSGEPGLQDIGRELGNLQSLLTVGSAGLDGQAIGRSLSMLGAQTAEAARNAPEDMRAGLQTLSDTLLKAGSKLEAQP